MTNRLVLAGCGNMGYAMLSGWLKSGKLAPSAVFVIEPNAELRQRAATLGCATSTDAGEIPADAVYLLTGYRADAALLRQAGVTLNERDAPVHDPETFETNVPGLFVAGGAIAGVDTGTIFIENGRFHGETIIDVIARRM